MEKLRKEDESDIEEPELVQVYLRMKPCNVPNNLYEVRSDKCLVTSLETATAGHGRRTQHIVYNFSHIFTSECSQKEVFEQVVKENLKKLVEGNSFTLLTYGASGSGKTYTLMGTVNSPGLIPRSLEYLFQLVDAAQMPMYKPSDNGADLLKCSSQEYELQWVKRLCHVSAPLGDKYHRVSAQLHNDSTVSSVDLTDRSKYYVWVSFVEIYNEAIYDLLAPPENRAKMRIREDTAGNVYVKGVTQAFVRSGEDAYDVMMAGKHNLIVGATGIHANSSRSHCIFTITVLAENNGDVRVSHVRLCDLAGCERQSATRNTGARMKESCAINSSLHVLERCLHMLQRKQRLMKDSHLVPYRESKLTRLLGSGLSGSRGEALSVVVTLNPAPQYANETKHVLSFAAVAQDIQINQTMLTSTTCITDSSTPNTTIYSSAETMTLREENDRLRFELAQSERLYKELEGTAAESQRQATATMLEISTETKEMMTEYYEAIITSLKSELAEVKEENERLLDSPPCRRPAAGSPLRCLQAKITQLMNEKVKLQDKLSETMLARAREEKELQHLQHCIEGRDDESIEFEEDESQTVVKNPVKVSETSAMQGSIFLENDEFDEESSEDLSIKKRGTFFLTRPSLLSLKSIEFKEEEDEPETEVKNSVKVSETSVSKIINSVKTDSSLTQFEQNEMVTNDLDNSKDKSGDLVDVNIFSKKRNYLEDDAKEGAINTTNTVQHKKLMTEVFKEHENGSETLPNVKNIKTQDTETIVSKIIKSLKPDSSLALFEALEMAVNDLEKCDNKNSDLVDVDMSNSVQFKNKIGIPLTSDQALDDARHYQENNTITEFEKHLKDLSHSRATQFDLLFTDEVSVTDTTRDKGTAQSKIAKDNDIQLCEKPKEKKEISEKTGEFEDIKYNLRHAGKPKTKKNLRLKRQKKIEVDSDNDSESKLKDIINLQKEFCDVTMNLPVVQKEVKDILYPEKLPGHDENVPPVMGIQSSPSKSETRSRRKLFTPRAEPFEESPTRTGYSSKRLDTPRPSYHRTRVRRFL